MAELLPTRRCARENENAFEQVHDTWFAFSLFLFLSEIKKRVCNCEEWLGNDGASECKRNRNVNGGTRCVCMSYETETGIFSGFAAFLQLA